MAEPKQETGVEGDIIGCRINFPEKKIGFSYNGKDIGYPFEKLDFKGPYYPGLTIYKERSHAKFKLGDEIT